MYEILLNSWLLNVCLLTTAETESKHLQVSYKEKLSPIRVGKEKQNTTNLEGIISFFLSCFLLHQVGNSECFSA